jgi:hypothetical protein
MSVCFIGRQAHWGGLHVSQAHHLCKLLLLPQALLSVFCAAVLQSALSVNLPRVVRDLSSPQNQNHSCHACLHCVLVAYCCPAACIVWHRPPQSPNRRPPHKPQQHQPLGQQQQQQRAGASDGCSHASRLQEVAAGERGVGRRGLWWAVPVDVLQSRVVTSCHSVAGVGS